MDGQFKDMQNNCDLLVVLMLHRGMELPSVEIAARSGMPEPRVMVRFAKAGAHFADEMKFFTGKTVEEALLFANAWIVGQPTAMERAQKDALELTARALEATRKAGFDTGEGEAFVAQLEAMMKRLSENVITDQSGAS